MPPSPGPLSDSGWLHISLGLSIVSGICVLAAATLTARSYIQHLKTYTQPAVQKIILRVLLMVPVYSITCFISLIAPQAGLYVESIRGLYEAFVIWQFFHLLMNLIGGERHLVHLLQDGRPPVNHPIPCKLFLPPLHLSAERTLITIKRGVLQYSLVKPITVFITLLVPMRGGVIAWDSLWMYLLILQNACVTTAMYSLLMFYQSCKQDLNGKQPLPKFLCIKGVIFATFWQNIFVHLFIAFGLLHDEGPFTVAIISRAIQDLLITLEMVGFALLHKKAFNHADFISTDKDKLSTWDAFKDALDASDIKEEAIATIKGRTVQPSTGTAPVGQYQDLDQQAQLLRTQPTNEAK